MFHYFTFLIIFRYCFRITFRFEFDNLQVINLNEMEIEISIMSVNSALKECWNGGKRASQLNIDMEAIELLLSNLHCFTYLLSISGNMVCPFTCSCHYKFYFTGGNNHSNRPSATLHQ